MQNTQPVKLPPVARVPKIWIDWRNEDHRQVCPVCKGKFGECGHNYQDVISWIDGKLEEMKNQQVSPTDFNKQQELKGTRNALQKMRDAIVYGKNYYLWKTTWKGKKF